MRFGKCLESVFAGSSKSVKTSLGEMGERKKGKKARSRGMREFYGSQKVGLQHVSWCDDVISANDGSRLAGIQEFLCLLVDREES